MKQKNRTRLYVLAGLSFFVTAIYFVPKEQSLGQTEAEELLEKSQYHDRPERVKPAQTKLPEENTKHVVKTRVEMFNPETTENQ